METELGVIEHNDGLVTGYREKPVLSYSASMGIYLYEPRALAGAAARAAASFPISCSRCSSAASASRRYETDADWHHVGTLAQHYEATRELARPVNPRASA